MWAILNAGLLKYSSLYSYSCGAAPVFCPLIHACQDKIISIHQYRYRSLQISFSFSYIVNAHVMLKHIASLTLCFVLWAVYAKEGGQRLLAAPWFLSLHLLKSYFGLQGQPRCCNCCFVSFFLIPVVC